MIDDNDMCSPLLEGSRLRCAPLNLDTVRLLFCILTCLSFRPLPTIDHSGHTQSIPPTHIWGMPGLEWILNDGTACSSYVCDRGIFSAEMTAGAGCDEATASAQQCRTAFSLPRLPVSFVTVKMCSWSWGRRQEPSHTMEWKFPGKATGGN